MKQIMIPNLEKSTNESAKSEYLSTIREIEGFPESFVKDLGILAHPDAGLWEETIAIP